MRLFVGGGIYTTGGRFPEGVARAASLTSFSPGSRTHADPPGVAAFRSDPTYSVVAVTDHILHCVEVSVSRSQYI
ncbi:hypothetical protein CSV80_15830 [Sporosarcina sp. P12(2017)]|nr:hypothetical protein CSV81_15835 [Sporosarcina sp. P10]PIC59462.1 hypothetical protein CSV80_15830 [Sporosarcina sp. P12(2017)]